MATWQENLSSWVRNEESSRIIFKKLIKQLITEFPNPDKFVENEPLINSRIREGLTSDEKKALFTELPKYSRSRKETEEDKALRKLKAKTTKKLEYYRLRIKDALFPETKKRKDIETNILKIGDLEREIFQLNEELRMERQNKKPKTDSIEEPIAEEIATEEEVEAQKNLDEEGMKFLSNRFSKFMPPGDYFEYFKNAWLANIPHRAGVYQFESLTGIIFDISNSNFN
jgi:hypothetical protein